MKIHYDDKTIENEIIEFKDLVLHLDTYLMKEKEGLESLQHKIIKLNLSNNARDLINQIISSQKLSYYFCYDERIKEMRNDNGIMKVINEVFKNNNDNIEKEVVIRKIIPNIFNQAGLITTQSFFGSEAEFHYLKNLIYNKILKIIKSCFDNLFTKNQQKNSNMNKKNNYFNYTTNFVLISHSCLKNAKFINDVLKKNGKLSLNNKLIKLYNCKPINPKNIRTFKKSLSSNELNIYDNSKIFNLYKSRKSTSNGNSSEIIINKNSSSCGESSNKILDFNSMNISNINSKKINFFTKKNINLIKRVSDKEHEKTYFLPILKMKETIYEKKPKIKWRKIPSVNSENMELINCNTKNNIRVKKEQTFLNECIKESIRNLFEINDTYKPKCFVDYYKSSFSSEKIAAKNNDEKLTKEKIIFPGFEYKNIIKYNFKGRFSLSKNKKN